MRAITRGSRLFETEKEARMWLSGKVLESAVVMARVISPGRLATEETASAVWRVEWAESGGEYDA